MIAMSRHRNWRRTIALATVLSLAGLNAAACKSRHDKEAREAAMNRAVELSAGVTALNIEDVKVGTGAEAVAGRRVTVHYAGTLMEGTPFDSSKDRNEPFQFVLGRREVIPGWDEGVKGMRVGGTRRLTIPSSMAYGPRGAAGVIPPNAALKFDIELLGVE
jgi:FKBP-type peptidyl-prolyl cis-trans isomerase FkpA